MARHIVIGPLLLQDGGDVVRDIQAKLHARLLAKRRGISSKDSAAAASIQRWRVSCIGRRGSVNLLVLIYATDRPGFPEGRFPGKCFRAVDSMSDGSPKLIAIDEEPNHQVVHAWKRNKNSEFML